MSTHQNWDSQKDPRLFCGAAVKKKRNYLVEPLDLPLPKFKHDQYWIGPVPAKECTFVNLNDNIDKVFLEEMCAKYGEIIDCKIYYHPKTKKHLGLAKVLFLTQRSARECCNGLDQTTKMGNKMGVFIDTMGTERSKMIDHLCNGLKPPQTYTTAPSVSSFDTSATNSPINSSLQKPPLSSFMPTTTTSTNAASSSSSPSSTIYPSNLFGPLGMSNESMTSSQLQDSSSSLDSRIAALFNINIPGIPGMANFSGASGAIPNSASSSTLASSSSTSGLIGAGSSLMPNTTSTSFHLDHLASNSNFLTKSPNVANVFQVIFLNMYSKKFNI